MEAIERIERLEKRYEKLYHEVELMATIMGKLGAWMESYLKASGNYRGAIVRDLKNLQNFLLIMDDDQQAHFKGHISKSRGVGGKKYDSI